MNSARIALFLFSLFTIHLLPTHTYSQTTNDQSELSIPWEEFKKLINLDEDEIVISLETYQKILAQTGAEISPSHTLNNGDIVMKREDFKNLIKKMKPPEPNGTKVPFNYLITKAVYYGKMNKLT